MVFLKTFLFSLLPNFIIRYFCSFSSRALYTLRTKGISEIALYGAGELGLETYLVLTQNNISIIKWVDIKANTLPFEQFDRTVESTEVLSELPQDVPVLICSQVTIEPMRKECIKRGLSNNQIITLE